MFFICDNMLCEDSWHINHQKSGQQQTMPLLGPNRFKGNDEFLPRELCSLSHCSGHLIYQCCYSQERAMGTSPSCSAAPAQAEKLCLLLLPGQVLQTWAELNRAWGHTQGNKGVPYSDCFNSVTFMYLEIKARRLLLTPALANSENWKIYF